MISPASGWRLFPPQHETIEKAHGRIEIRRIWVSDELDELNGYIDFPYAAQVFRIERITTEVKSKRRRCEVVLGITSLSATKAAPKHLLKLNRGHWGIENRLHYVRDVTFGEDKSTVRTKSAPRVMATIRNLAISLLRLNKVTNIAKAIRYYAAKPHLTLNLIGL